MTKLYYAVVVALLVSCAVTACPAWWQCADSADTGANWRVVSGSVTAYYVLPEELSTATFEVMEWDFKDDAGAIHSVDLSAFEELKEAASTPVLLALRDGAVAAFRYNGTAAAPTAQRLTTFLRQNLRGLTSASYQEATPLTLRVGVIPYRFGSARMDATAAELRQRLDGPRFNLPYASNLFSVKSVLENFSHGRFRAEFTYYPEVDLGPITAGCEYSKVAEWINRARAATGLTGNAGAIDFIMLVGTRHPDCRFSGRAGVSGLCEDCYSINFDGTASTMMHELGHNIGFPHSGMGSSQYGDFTDFMGRNAGMAGPNAIKQLTLGTINRNLIQWSPGYGVYSLQSLDTASRAGTTRVLFWPNLPTPVTVSLRSNLTGSFISSGKTRFDLWNDGVQSGLVVNAGVGYGYSSQLLSYAIDGDHKLMPIEGSSLNVKLGSLKMVSGIATDAYVSVCNGASCPPYRFAVGCSSGRAVEVCAHSGYSYPRWFCLATGSPRVASSLLGTGKSCTNFAAGSTNPNQVPPSTGTTSSSSSSSSGSSSSGSVTSGSSSSGSSTGGSGGTVRPDNRCGSAFGNAPCRSGYCCSSFGYCGTASSHCRVSNGCQSGCWANEGRVAACDLWRELRKSYSATVSSRLTCAAQRLTGLNPMARYTVGSARGYGLLGFQDGVHCGLRSAGGYCNAMCGQYVTPYVDILASCVRATTNRGGLNAIPAYAVHGSACQSATYNC